MKHKLIDVRPAYIDLFEPGQKYGKFGTQIRFNKETKYKELLEDAIDEVGSAAFGAKWERVKKSLHDGGKIFKVYDGKAKGYEEDYYIGVYNATRPSVVGRDANPIGASDRIIYPGCRVDVIIDVSAFVNKKGDNVVSVKLLGVQFRGDDTPYISAPKAEISDFEVLTAGADSEDL